MTNTQAELNQLKPLIGGRITSLLETPDHQSFGFVVTLPDQSRRDVWVDCDPEGNGPGHLDIAQP